MAAAEDTLTRTWASDSGMIGWLTAVNHKSVGIRFIVTAFIFFLLAGILAILMRLQLALPELNVLPPEAYNQFFTMHGTAMMFLFAIPMLEGLGIYFVPLMIGARDMVFPRLNAFGYWVYLIAGVMLFFSVFTGQAPNAGWFNYVPLAGDRYSPGINIDYYVTLVTFLEVSALVAAVELIITVFKARAPGMSINRLPLFVWAQLVTSFLIVFAMPVLMAVSMMLALDRKLGTHFFDSAMGGDPLLWQHLFWIFGHPDVYIMLLPALGMLSMVVAAMTHHHNVAYNWLILSFVAIGFLSFGIWAHHMYTTGLPLLGLHFFAAISIMIAIPSGIQAFSWIATVWGGRPVFTTAFLYLIGFFFVFIRGGITGVMVASVAFDWQAHDSYFVVAHFHDVLIGGVLFPIFAGLYYWFPKLTGRMLSERVGKWQFWLTFIGYNVAFFTMYYTGSAGMPRRYYTYLPGLGWGILNLISTIGVIILTLGILLLVIDIIRSLRNGEPAGDNPWRSNTLEWAVSSPPPTYNFRTALLIDSRNPLWEQTGMDPEQTDRPGRVLLGTETWREQLATTLLDAKPDHRQVLPQSSIWPLLLALSVAVIFFGELIDIILVPIGAIFTYISIIGWTYPREQDWQREY